MLELGKGELDLSNLSLPTGKIEITNPNGDFLAPSLSGTPRIGPEPCLLPKFSSNIHQDEPVDLDNSNTIARDWVEPSDLHWTGHGTLGLAPQRLIYRELERYSHVYWVHRNIAAADSRSCETKTSGQDRRSFAVSGIVYRSIYEVADCLKPNALAVPRPHLEANPISHVVVLARQTESFESTSSNICS